MKKRPYRGRFAPSPTGKLHFGSLVAAVASYLDARANHGEWLIRIENIDPPREVHNSATDILSTLEAFGFQWDDSVLYQSDRFDRYAEIVSKLIHSKKAYPCACSRREIAAIAAQGLEGNIYPGTCREGLPEDREGRAVRLLTNDKCIRYEDLIQGHQQQCLESEIGDFVIKRADGFFAYQLGVVIDDHDQGITDIVRGCDLLHSTARQIHLQQVLGYSTPTYAHFPVVLDDKGNKLSKQDLAHPVDSSSPYPALEMAMRFLNQSIPDTSENLEQWWQQAIEGWSLSHIPAEEAIQFP